MLDRLNQLSLQLVKWNYLCHHSPKLLLILYINVFRWIILAFMGWAKLLKRNCASMVRNSNEAMIFANIKDMLY